MKRCTLLVPLCLCSGAWGQALSLEQALTSARSSRQAVVAANTQVKSVQAQARASSLPSPLKVGAGHSFTEGLGATDQDLYLSQELDLFGKSRTTARVARASVDLAQAAVKQTLLDIQTEVLEAYVSALSAQKQLEVSQSLLAVAESVHQTVLRLVEEGKAPEVQATRAGIERDRAWLAALNRRSSLEAALRRLAGAAGISTPPPAVAEILLPEPGTDRSPRPDQLCLEAQIEEAAAEIASVQRASLPSLEVIGLRSPWGESPTTFGVRLQMTWGLYDHGRLRQEREALSLKRASLTSSIADLKAGMKAELEALDAEIAAHRDRLSSLGKVRAAAADLAAKTEKGFAQGYGSLLDVLEAARAMRELEQEIVETEASLNRSIAAKYRTSGSLIEVTR